MWSHVVKPNSHACKSGHIKDADISKMALKVLIPFPTTYECESAFSALLAIKPKVETS